MIWKQAAKNAVFSPQRMGKADLGAGEHIFAGLNCFAPGQDHKAHTHPDQDKLYVVLEGRAEASVGDQTAVIELGDVVLAAAGRAALAAQSWTGESGGAGCFRPTPGPG